MRLQKKIAENSKYSRRKAEELIVAGKVRVNGKLVKVLGTKVEPDDVVEIDGIKLAKRVLTTLVMNKPRGVLTSRFDPHHSQNILNLLPKRFRSLKPAGRLDFESEGLMVLSNDGDLIAQLTHPRYGHRKIYEVLIKGLVTEKELEPLEQGFRLDEVVLNPMPFKILKEENGNTWVKLTLSEGRNRQIRRCMEQLGKIVLRLKRSAINGVTIDDLKPGDFKVLGQKELALLLSPNV